MVKSSKTDAKSTPTSKESTPQNKPDAEPKTPKPAAAKSAEQAVSDKPVAAEDEGVQAAPLSERLQQVEQENAQLQDQFLRAKAEAENIRNRSQKEIVAARKFAIEGIARELLGVKDSLEQAALVELDEASGESVQQMKEGLLLTLKQFDLVMAKFSVVEVEAAPGVRFDPEYHQAISTAPSEEFESDHIVSVVQKGFLLKQRLLRPAMVVVATKA